MLTQLSRLSGKYKLCDILQGIPNIFTRSYMPKVNVNLRSARGESALSMALDKKNQTIAQVLLAQGADVNNIDVNGEPLVARMVRTYNVMGLRFLIGEDKVGDCQ